MSTINITLLCIIFVLAYLIIALLSFVLELKNKIRELKYGKEQ